MFVAHGVVIEYNKNMKRDLKIKVQNLRLEGRTYTEILTLLQSPVAKSTISLWCREIQLTPEQKQMIEKASRDKLIKSRVKAWEVIRNKRREYLANLYSNNSYLFEVINNKDSAKVVLAALYLAEGKKNAGHIMFGNSDSLIISLFLRLLRFCYDLDESKFRCTLQCRADQNIRELEEYWQRITNISKTQFYKVQIDPRTIGKKSKKIDYKGVCRIDYFSADVYNNLTVIGSIICK